MGHRGPAIRDVQIKTYRSGGLLLLSVPAGVQRATPSSPCIDIVCPFAAPTHCFGFLHRWAGWLCGDQRGFPTLQEQGLSPSKGQSCRWRARLSVHLPHLSVRLPIFLPTRHSNVWNCTVHFSTHLSASPKTRHIPFSCPLTSFCPHRSVCPSALRATSQTLASLCLSLSSCSII